MAEDAAPGSTTETTSGGMAVADGGVATAAPPEWRASLPEDIRGEKMLERFKGSKWEEVGPALAKSVVHAERYISGAVKVPGADAKLEEIKAFHAKLGVPDSPDKYEITPPSLPEGTTDLLWSPAMEREFRRVAHESGLTPAQVKALVEFESRRAMTAKDTVTQRLAASQAEAETTLKAEWGPAVFQRNVDLAKTALREFAPPEYVARLDSTGEGNDPVIIKTWAAIGAKMLEDNLVQGEVTGFTTKEHARREREELMSDRSGPFWTAGHPRHEWAVERVRQLYGIEDGAI
jgi:hypothetical protein